MKHNTISFYSFQKTFIDYIKNKYPQFEKIHYFSDGSAAQYKNKKNFINICHHKDDFGLEAEWHFFATSHGKSPCDGAGGTIKRTVKKASLQRTADHHILTPTAMFDFCSTQIPGIKFFLYPFLMLMLSKTFCQKDLLMFAQLKIQETTTVSLRFLAVS